jgi:hypothetical protein
MEYWPSNSKPRMVIANAFAAFVVSIATGFKRARGDAKIDGNQPQRNCRDGSRDLCFIPMFPVFYGSVQGI